MVEEKREPLKVDNGSRGVRILNSDYPSNSRRVVTEKKEEKKVKKKKIISGKVILKKKPFLQRVKDSLFGDGLAIAGSYVLNEILVPAAKSTISDMINGATDMVLFNDDRYRPRRERRGRTIYTPYDKRYDRGRDREERQYSRVRRGFEDLIFSSRRDAEEIRDHLVDMITEYGAVSIADLYDAVEIDSTNFTDDKYGWTSLRNAVITSARGGGYLLELPKPKLID